MRWWIGLVGACAALAIGGVPDNRLAAQVAARRSAADFAQLPMIEGPVLSPDGTMIAGKLGIQGAQYFAIIPIGGGAPRVIPTKGNDLNWWQWVNDDWLVLGIGGKAPLGRYGDAYVRRALGVSADGKKSVQLEPKSGNVGQVGDRLIWRATDGSPRIQLAMQRSIDSTKLDFWPAVIEFDVSTGDSRQVVAPKQGVMGWISDGDGVVRMGHGSSMDGRTSRILYRGTEGEGFREISRTRRGQDAEPTPDLFLKDGRAIAFAPDAAGFTGVFEYDTAAMALGKPLHVSPGFDVGAIIPSRDKTSLAGVEFAEDRDRTVWLDPDLVAMQKEVAGAVKGGEAELYCFDQARKRAIVRVGATDSPGAFYLFDRPTGQMALLSHGNPALKLARLNPVRTIRYKARDGLEIAAVVTTPKGRTGALPLIVLPHGGPHARDNESWDWWTQFLADRGYLVVQPNYRGSSGYGSEFARKGQGQWGLAMQDDLNDVVAHLAKEGVADPGRVCIMGASYGGYAAVRAAQRDPGLYRCAVSYAGVFDLNEMVRYDRGFLYAGGRSDWLREQAPDLRGVSPVHGAEQVGIPVLLLHGKEDTVVPVAQSRAMASALRSKGRAVDYVEQPEGDHHFSRSDDRRQFLEAIEAFLMKHNPA